MHPKRGKGRAPLKERNRRKKVEDETIARCRAKSRVVTTLDGYRRGGGTREPRGGDGGEGAEGASLSRKSVTLRNKGQLRFLRVL